MTDDGRHFRPIDGELHAFNVMMPEPPRDGDALYCEGQRIGTFKGKRDEPGGWYIETVSTKLMPPALAAHIRGRATALSRYA
jgi:hypothetical protein